MSSKKPRLPRLRSESTGNFPKTGFSGGTLVQASDRRYEVTKSGAWRVLPESVGKKVEKPKQPICQGGRNTYTGTRCYCPSCKEKRSDERRRTENGSREVGRGPEDRQ